MRLKFVFVLIFSAFFCVLSAQNPRFQINGMNTNITTVGFDTRLILNYPEVKNLKIRATGGGVTVRKIPKAGMDTASLSFICTGLVTIKILDDKTIVDSFHLEVKRLSFNQFARCEGVGLIKEGTHSKEVLQKIQSIEIAWNMPWLKTQFSGYNLHIYNPNNEPLLSKRINSNSFIDKEIQAAIAQMKSGGYISIQDIYGGTPYDDGERPKNMIFYCK